MFKYQLFTSSKLLNKMRFSGIVWMNKKESVIIDSCRYYIMLFK